MVPDGNKRIAVSRSRQRLHCSVDRTHSRQGGIPLDHDDIDGDCCLGILTSRGHD